MSNTTSSSPTQSANALTVRTLRKLFLTLFLRGRMSRGFKKETAPKSVVKKLGLTLLMYAVFGGIMAWALHGSVYVLSLYLHGMTTMVVGMFIVMTAGEALFNKDESEILMHRPVSSRILLTSKISVLVVVSLWIAGAFNLVGFVVGVAFSPDGSWLWPVAHALSTTLEACFCVSCVVLLYQLCMKWFGRERLDNLMTTVQVLMGVIFFAGSQIIPRLMQRSPDSITTVAHVWWISLLPPAWFAGIDDAIAGSGATGSWGTAGAGMFATVLVAWLAFVKLADTYETGLQVIGETTSKPNQRVAENRKLQWLVNTQPIRWWLGDSISRAAFVLCTAYLFRNRDVKLRVFPGIAPMLVMPILFMMQSRSDSTVGIALSMGMVCLVPIFAQGLLQYSEQWQASDLFRAAPMVGPAALCNGARHSVLLFLTVPMVVLLVIAVVVMEGSMHALAAMMPGVLALPVFAMYPCMGGHTVPLSIAGDESKSVGRSLKMIGFMLASFALSGIVILSFQYDFFGILLSVETLVVAVVYWLMRKSMQSVRWASME